MALQIVQCKSSSRSDFENTFQLRHENISNLLNQVGERPISILSICGPSNLGKSLFLNYIIRCLEATERGIDEWIDKANPEKVPKGFQWKAVAPFDTADVVNWLHIFEGDDITTTKGICLYNKPFILKNCRGKEYAVIVMDTQGIYHYVSTHLGNKAVIGLCMLLSSVTILNLPTDSEKIDEVLKSLKVYCEYGNLASNEYLGKPYGKLQFLFRDWKETAKYPLGKIGGRNFLKNRMHQTKDIRNYFADTDCFLLPRIQGNGLQKKHFDGSLASMNKSFGCKMEELISSIVENDLYPRKIGGNLLTAKDVRLYLYGYIECFNQRQFPTANTLLVTTQGVEIIDKCLQHHRKFYKDFQTGPRYLTATSFVNAQKEAAKQAMKYYDDDMKSLNVQKADQHVHLKKLLEREIKRESDSFKSQNDKKRAKALIDAQTAAMNVFNLRFEQKYQSQINSLRGFGEFKNTFFAREHGNVVKQVAFSDFINNLCGNETEDEINNLWRPMRIQFDDIIEYTIEEIIMREQKLTQNKGSKLKQSRLTMSMGNLSHGDDNQPSCLNCPICFEVHQGKVFQCKNGHVICEKCSDSVKNCPQCRIPFTGKSKIRNRALEEIIEKLQLSQK